MHNVRHECVYFAGFYFGSLLRDRQTAKFFRYTIVDLKIDNPWEILSAFPNEYTVTYLFYLYCCLFFFQFYLFFFQSDSKRGRKRGRGGGSSKVNIKNSPILLRDGDTVGVKVSVCIPHR